MKKGILITMVISSFLVFCFPTTEALGYCSYEKTEILYSEKDEAKAVFNNTHRNVTITDKDIYLMAQVVYGESRGEPFQGKVAVASVILNRAKNKNFPNSIDGVVKQKGAFSCVKNGTISVIPNEECYNAVFEALKGDDPTNHALYFYNPKIATCSWMKNTKKSNKKAIGQHVFFIIN